MLRPGPLVLAVSGGTDSTALCLILAELRDEFGLVLHVAHFDHRARPRAAAADAAFAAELANTSCAAPLGRAAARRRGVRRAQRRYEFLRRFARELGRRRSRPPYREITPDRLLNAPAATDIGPRRHASLARRHVRLYSAGRRGPVRPVRRGFTPREDPTNRSLHSAEPIGIESSRTAKANPEITSAARRGGICRYCCRHLRPRRHDP